LDTGAADELSGGEFVQAYERDFLLPNHVAKISQSTANFSGIGGKLNSWEKATMPVYYGRGLPPEEYEPQVAREDELGWFLPPLRSLPVMRSKRWVIDTGTDRVWIPDPTLGGYQPCGGSLRRGALPLARGQA